MIYRVYLARGNYVDMEAATWECDVGTDRVLVLHNEHEEGTAAFASGEWIAVVPVHCIRENPIPCPAGHIPFEKV
jgi:hypothetical protein